MEMQSVGWKAAYSVELSENDLAGKLDTQLVVVMVAM